MTFINEYTVLYTGDSLRAELTVLHFMLHCTTTGLWPLCGSTGATENSSSVIYPVTCLISDKDGFQIKSETLP